MEHAPKYIGIFPLAAIRCRHSSRDNVIGGKDCGGGGGGGGGIGFKTIFFLSSGLLQSGTSPPISPCSDLSRRCFTP